MDDMIVVVMSILKGLQRKIPIFCFIVSHAMLHFKIRSAEAVSNAWRLFPLFITASDDSARRRTSFVVTTNDKFQDRSFEKLDQVGREKPHLLRD